MSEQNLTGQTPGIRRSKDLPAPSLQQCTVSMTTHFRILSSKLRTCSAANLGQPRAYMEPEPTEFSTRDSASRERRQKHSPPVERFPSPHTAATHLGKRREA